MYDADYNSWKIEINRYLKIYSKKIIKKYPPIIIEQAPYEYANNNMNIDTYENSNNPTVGNAKLGNVKGNYFGGSIDNNDYITKNTKFKIITKNAYVSIIDLLPGIQYLYTDDIHITPIQFSNILSHIFIAYINNIGILNLYQIDKSNIDKDIKKYILNTILYYKYQIKN